MSTKRILTLLPLLLLLLSFGCGSDTENPVAGSQGVLQIYLTDSSRAATALQGPVKPREVWVDVGEIDVRKGNDMSWQSLSQNTGLINLVALKGTQSLIGSDNLPNGTYTAFRLFVKDGYVVDDSGAHHDLKVPSEKIQVNAVFEVREGKVTKIIVDFDGEKSLLVIQTQGRQEWILRPVLRVASIENS